jgi:glycosyltransferase involved in cell wall biosynthesis
MTFTVANIVSSFNSRSGGPPGTVNLIAAAGRGHWNAELFTTDFRESASDTLLFEEFPGKVHVLPAAAHGLRGGLGMMMGLDRGYRTRLIGARSPDVMHIHGLWSPYLAAFANTAIRHAIPYVVAPHGMLEKWSLQVRSMRKNWALKSYQGRILAHAACLHATSPMEAESMRRLGLTAPIFVVPNPVSEPPEVGEPLDEPATTDSNRVLLFLSRLHEKKGLDMLLAAWNDLRPPGWRLVIAGSGEPRYVEGLLRFREAHQIPNVEFVPHTEGLSREMLFKRASAFVLPTYSENFGNVVAEALVRGLPVLTTTGTPWKDLVTHGCGWYIEPTLEALKTTLAEVVETDSKTLARMGERGRAYAVSSFSLSAIRQEFLRMYQTAMRAGRQAA